MTLMKLLGRTLKIIDLIFWTDYQTRLHNHSIGFHNSAYQFKRSEIAFVHIPKTGGTSLHRLLSKDVQRRFVNLNMHQPISRLCNPQEYSYVTVMRNPVERVWSYYQMVLRNPPGYPYKRFADEGLECFLKHCWEVRNMACRYYSGEIKEEPTARTLDLALSNLENFICVIDMDYFEKQVADFMKKNNIPMNPIPHERKSNYAPCSRNDNALIRKYNILDMKMFVKWKGQSTGQQIR